MKVLKKLTALGLCAASLCALLVAPASAAAVVSTFSDITDPAVGQAVEALRTMGVIDGVTPDSYAPNDYLTRAQFCKLAVVTMGRGNEVAAYSTRTIFPDVAGGHWARGYVNMAASISVGGTEEGGGSRLIMGIGDGTFAPDRAITYAEAVTILLRVLGYGAQANTNWPNGAMSTASSIGLTGGVNIQNPNARMSRGNAAILFYNLLNTPINGSNSIYAASLGSVEQGALMISCNTVAENGKSGAVKLLTSGSGEVVRLAAVNTPAAFLQGARGTAVFNQDGLFLTFLPEKGVTSRTIITAKATAGTNGVITATDGTQVTVPASATVWYNGQRRTYSEIYTTLNRAGVTVTVYYTAAGAVDYLYVGGVAESTAGNVMAVKTPVTGNPFAGITGGQTGYTILKNGVTATVGDLRQYDVGAFDAATNTLYVTDFRLTGVYQGAAPNLTAPSKITVFNRQFDVLDSAIDDLQKFKLGDTFTLLFAPDGKVAGVVSASETRSNVVGTVDPNSTDSSVTVHLLGAPETIATISGSCTNVDGYKDSLVSVAAGAGNTIYLSRLSGSGATAPLNVKARTVGNDALAENVSVYERVGGGALTAISLADMNVDTVPAAKITYVHKNYADRIDLLVLDDVTGDLYTYGIAKMGTKEGGFGELSYANTTTTVTNGTDTLTTIGGSNFRDGQFIGLAPSLSTLDGESRMAGSVALKSVTGVSQSNFNLDTMRFFSGSVELPVWEGVQCYNAQTRTWFNSKDISALDALNTCLAYSSNLTVYYDRDPNQGGKVRVVVAN